MAQQEVGNGRKPFSHPLPQSMYVLDQTGPVGKEAVLLRPFGGLAVAQMVVAADGEAVGGQEFREGGVALDILADAVDQLDHSPDLPLRQPHHSVDLMRAVGGRVEKFLHPHSFLSSFVIIYRYSLVYLRPPRPSRDDSPKG